MRSGRYLLSEKLTKDIGLVTIVIPVNLVRTGLKLFDCTSKYVGLCWFPKNEVKYAANFNISWFTGSDSLVR